MKIKEKLIDGLCWLSTKVSAYPRRFAMFIVFLLLVITVLLASGCGSTTKQIENVPTKNELINKYEGQVAINDWEESDKQLMITYINNERKQ